MNQTPRISVNKLGEYAVASPGRRRAIVKAQQEPPPQIIPLYQRAYPVLERFFATRDPEVIVAAADAMRATPPKSDWDAADLSNTALGLNTFLEFAHTIELPDCQITRGHMTESRKLSISGVDVSVRPDFYIRLTRRKRPLIGAFKFHWTKGDDNSLMNEGGIYVATTLHQFLDSYYADEAPAAPEFCFSIDVFRRVACVAPAAFKRRREHIVAACEEIALRWNQ